MRLLRRKSQARKRPQAAPWRARLPAMPWRHIARGAAGLAVLAGLVFAARPVLDAPIERVAITGRFQRVQPLEVEKAVRAAVRGQGMVGVDLARIAREVEGIAWVDHASVARSWPRGLAVRIVEQVPVARWGETGLVNVRGELFVQDPRHIPAELPELIGPPGYEHEMTARCLAAQPRLAEAGMRLARLTLDERGAWEVALDGGITLRLGRQAVDERFDRFLSAAARVVAERAAEILYVDMRYANGFAVGWRAAASGVKRGQAQ